MSIFSGSTEMLRKVKEAIEKSASEVKEKLLGIIEDAKNEQEEVNSNLKQAIDREAARNDVQDEKIEDHERKIHLTQQELNFFKEDQAKINKSLDSAIVAEKERNDQQDETLKQHSEAIEKNTADILENADKAHQDLEAHKEESAAKFEDLSQKVDTNTQNIKQTREELQEQLGEHDNRITENKNQIAANAEKAERAIESAVLDLKKSILETNKDVMQNATNINLISKNVDEKIEDQNLRIEAIKDLLDELIKEVKEEFKVLHSNTTFNSEQISILNQSVAEINSLIDGLELDTKGNTGNINLIFKMLGTSLWGTVPWRWDGEKKVLQLFGGIAGAVMDAPWKQHEDVNEIVIEDKTILTGAIPHLFENLSQLKRIKGAVFLDTEAVTDMFRLFNGCSLLESVDVSAWDVSSVTRFNDMFRQTHNLLELDLSNWKVTNAGNLSRMFQDSRSLTALDFSGFVFDHEKNINLNSMFAGADKIKKLTLGQQSVFTDRSSLEEITEDGYTGRWVGENTGMVFESSLALMRDYDGSVPDTYIAEKNVLKNGGTN